MASARKNQAPRYNGTTAADIARFGVRRARGAVGAAGRGAFSLKETDARMKEERTPLRRKVIIWAAVMVVLVLVSLCIMGNAGGGYPGTSAYTVYSPLDMVYALYLHAYNLIADITHLMGAYSGEWLLDNAPAYFALPERASVVFITLLCAVLLGVSGSLYQSVFKNPIAGPGMLGVGGGVNMGMMLLVYLFGSSATSMMGYRYAFCYGLGAAILLFVVLAGRRLSGKGKPFDIVTMLLLGSIVSQLMGFIVSYVTLFVMDPGDYEVYYNLSQMLTVDTSLLSWACLGIACVVSLVPVWRLRFKFNALAFEEEEVKLMGINATGLRAAALLCGAIMVLAAQIHIGAVAMISLIVPFLARSWFGCEFRKQLVGCVCVGTVLLLVCRDICDLIPFVGDGMAIGSVVAVVAMPLFLLIMSRHMRGWE